MRLLSTFLFAIVAMLTLPALIVPSGAVAQDPPQVSATVEPTTTTPGSVVRYTVQAVTERNHDIRVIREPRAEGMQVVGRATDSQINIVGRTAHRTLNITYSLRVPHEEGAYVIEAPLLMVGSERVSPSPVQVRVVAQDQIPRTVTPQTRDDEEVFVEVSVTPDRNPYVGEQLNISYNLLVNTRQMRVRPRPPSDPPLDAFWVEEMSQHIVGRRQLHQSGGRTWEKTPLRVLAAFPLREGPAVIDSITVPTARGGIFGWSDEQDVNSKEVVLEVQPLPPGAPPHFGDGNVGQWAFTARPDVRTARVGGTLTIVATATGPGRAGRAGLPPVPESDDYRIISTSTDTEQFVQSEKMMGRRIERHTIMPTREGMLTIPPMTFAYFDPDAGEYRTIESQPFNIRVEAGDLPPEPEELEPVAEVSRTPTGEGDINGALIAGLRPLNSLSSSRDIPAAPPGQGLFWLLIALPLLGFVGILAGRPLGQRIARDRGPKIARKKAWKSTEELLARAKTQSGPAGYDLLLQAIRKVMVDIIGLPPGSVTDTELPGVLKKRGVSEDLATRIGEIVATCTLARFAPERGRDKNVPPVLVEESQTILRMIEAALNPKTSRKAGASSMLIVSLVLLVAGPASALKMDQRLTQAFEHSEAGQWAEAAQLWQELADSVPRDPMYLFNAGTAHAHAGDLAGSRLYLERAGLLSPRDADIRANLDIVRDLVEFKAPLEGDLFWWRVAASLSETTLTWAIIIALWLAFFAFL
ncbi:MAG: BatD family protein, partial [Bradymonadaceae bacterium]